MATAAQSQTENTLLATGQLRFRDNRKASNIRTFILLNALIPSSPIVVNPDRYRVRVVNSGIACAAGEFQRISDGSPDKAMLAGKQAAFEPSTYGSTSLRNTSVTPPGRS